METSYSRRRLAVLLALLSVATAAEAQIRAAVTARQLADLTLEQLGNVQVTSVSGRPESIQASAASIYVITAQEIRRSAATSLPEALRLAPNLQVAQTSAGQFAISARGFQDLIANKLLVMVDGRTIYSPLFAGVFWDANDERRPQQIRSAQGTGETSHRSMSRNSRSTPG